MAWVGYLEFPDHIQYMIENKVIKLNKQSKKEEWLECHVVLRKFKHYIYNAYVDQKELIFPSYLWSFVHHAAYHSAPLEIIQMINIDKYPLSLPDGEGKIALDHIDTNMPQNYKDLLQPVYKIDFLPLEMKLIQANFHAVIYECIDGLVEKYNLILPVLCVMLEDISKCDDERKFPIPDSGGFTYKFDFSECMSEVKALLCNYIPSLEGGTEISFKCTADGWSVAGDETTL